MSYTKCYWGQFIILDLDYITYFSYKNNNNNNNNNQNPSTGELQIDKYNSMKNKLKPTTSYKDLNTLQLIYETQFDFDEEMSNPNRGCDGAERAVTDPEYGTLMKYSTIKELDTSAERDDIRTIPLYTQITRPIIMILCMTAVSLYIIL